MSLRRVMQRCLVEEGTKSTAGSSGRPLFSNLSVHWGCLFLILTRTSPVQDIKTVSTKPSLVTAAF